jgi:hypothetical protein
VKATLTGEVLLLVGVLALAYFLWVQQGQLVELELELDRMRGSLGVAVPPVPVASDNGEAVMPEAPKPRPRRKAAPGA